VMIQNKGEKKERDETSYLLYMSAIEIIILITIIYQVRYY